MKLRRLFAVILLLACAPFVAGQPQQDPFSPPLDPVVKKLLDDDATSEAEKRRLALFHGQWDRIDNPTLTERALIALAKYELSDESLRDEKTPAFLRARAAFLRGEPEAVEALLKEDTTAQAAMLRAEALEQLGKSAEAIALLTPWRTKLQVEQFTDPAELVAAARSIVFLAQLEGRPSQDYQTAMKLFGKARSDIDRLYWPASLAEAEVLIEKDNADDGIRAVIDVLKLNPRCAEAARLLGEFGASRFNFDAAAQISAKLRQENADHPLAAIIDATSFLVQKDAESARKVIEPMLAVYPNHRDMLALLAAVEAISYNEKQLDAVLKHYDKLSGDNPAALVAAGSFLSHARQYEWSERLLRKAVERRPNSPGPRIELGLMLMQAGKEEAAEVELRRAAQLDPFNIRARNQLRLVEELLGYELIELDHFIIKYKKGIDEVLARDMEEQLESMYDMVTGAFEHKPARKTFIEIMPDEQWFGVRITGLPEIWTIAACTGDVVAMTPPRAGPKQHGTYDWYRVLQHEYTHTVTLDQTAYRIPHWFTEGAAVSMEPGQRDYQMSQLLASALQEDELFTLNTITWGFVRPKKQTDRALAYAQAHWMIEFITHRFGHEAILKMLAMHRQGTPDVKTILEVTGQSEEAFMTAFKEWATKQVQQWGLNSRDDDEVIMRKLQEATQSERVNAKFAAELLKDHPDHPAALRIAAQVAMDDDPAKAKTAVLLYAAARPIDPWSHKSLYTIAQAKNDDDGAIAALAAVDRFEVSSGAWSHRLAELYRKQGQFSLAATAITRALHREPYSAPYRELAAAIYIQTKDLPTAAHHVRALTLLEPDRSIHLTRLAAIYAMMGDKAKSKAAAEAARKLDPKAPVDRFLN
ncbi:MAG: tetratricopeptide repeat protein [Phycisphaeraceae bacterium]